MEYGNLHLRINEILEEKGIAGKIRLLKIFIYCGFVKKKPQSIENKGFYRTMLKNVINIAEYP